MNTSNPEPHCLSPSLHLSSALPGPSFLPAAPDNYSFPSFAFNLSLNTLSFLLLCFFSCFHSQVPDQTALLLGDKLGRSRSGGNSSSPTSPPLWKQGMEGWWKSSVEGRSPSDMCAQPKGRDRHRPPTDIQTSKQTIMTKMQKFTKNLHTCTTCRARHGKFGAQNLLIATQTFTVLKYGRRGGLAGPVCPNFQQRDCTLSKMSALCFGTHPEGRTASSKSIV